MTGGAAGRGARTRAGDFPTLVEEARTWPVVLDALEGDVQEAEETLARGRAEEIATWGRRTTDWVPPSNLGPLPDDLRERAAQLLQHQLAVAEQLVERITQSQKQRDVAARMSYAPARPVALYVDRAM
jgi:hypothetical protein